MRKLLGISFAVGLVAGCGNDSEEGPQMTREELLDPLTCKECHAEHYQQWSGSMHAYASTDPVFLAMNARGQRDTGGNLGAFCVNCHAPMAVREGAITDGGLNLSEVPSHLQGITCYFCHNVERVDGTHNNPLVLSNDTTMRGGITSPVANRAHHSEYSELLDGKKLKSTEMCGPCHDIVLDPSFAPDAVHLERTYAEWQTTVYNTEGLSRSTCVSCHMDVTPDKAIADAPNVVPRNVHDHRFPGIDVALTPFPVDDPEEQQRQLDAVKNFLSRSLTVQICVGSQVGNIVVWLENSLAGHAWPSGAAQDRRAWVELKAYHQPAPDMPEELIFQSGVVPDGQSVVSLADPDLWLLRDKTFGVNGEEVHMFWEVARYDSTILPPPDSMHNNRKSHAYAGTAALQPILTRVTVRVRIQPIGLDVLDELDLDPAIREAMPTFDVLPYASSDVTFEWTDDAAYDLDNPYASDGAGFSRCLSGTRWN